MSHGDEESNGLPVLQLQTLGQLASDVTGLVMLGWLVASSSETWLDGESFVCFFFGAVQFSIELSKCCMHGSYI